MIHSITTRIRDVAEKVKAILTIHPNARDNDHLLYGFVLNTYGLSINTPFITIYTKVYQKEIPSIESIGRARRKVQQLYPELRGSQYIQEARINATAEFISFSQDKSI